MRKEPVVPKIANPRNHQGADTDAKSMVSHLSFDCVLLLLLLLTRSSEGAYVAEVGQNADLPCTYSPTTSENLVPICWGKGSCPVFECHNTVLSTDGRNLKYQTSNRYRLMRNFHKGDVSLTIENVTLADSGTYCCRIQFPGLMNDKKSNLELVIKPAKVIATWTPWRDFTAPFPLMLTTKGHGSETQTLVALHDKQTQIPTLANELEDAGATTRLGVYIGAGISAGLALIFIIGALILTWYSYSKEKLQNSSLVTLANPSPLGLANTGAEGMRSQENIYIIEENIYEMEDPYEYYCYVNSEQQS
ncbi:hepatitis A virus cellular receptor 2 isoform X1 [Canis lupus baileyi]|nr:hepatitis A virus cellular receptor 2 [Canis lupus dingo]XP_038518217.1 hepatitis A virus cellular receptor 2 isoform X1 [Canis lupus familiaris]XP_038518218.1 hepatitis A virus cellular receptor 2 isoform X1 [Canis lupus familiaris]XP_048965160.1 hepatitis A virus cellular receptor 2 [Canis lupus dingo]|eukprot:XP_022273051.1 hepatitis A virus cellular receptor 1 isoform X1 [Canis lupus familiaris]